MAGSAVAADALLLALAPVAARRAGRVAENAAPARPAVALPARRVTRRTVLALTLVPTKSFSLLKGQSVTVFLGYFESKTWNFGQIRCMVVSFKLKIKMSILLCYNVHQCHGNKNSNHHHTLSNCFEDIVMQTFIVYTPIRSHNVLQKWRENLFALSPISSGSQRDVVYLS